MNVIVICSISIKKLRKGPDSEAAFGGYYFIDLANFTGPGSVPLDGLLVTTHQRSCGKLVFSHVSVCPQEVDISVSMAFLGVGISGPMSLLGGRWVCPWDGPTHPRTWDTTDTVGK